ncbi:uncharacterized protein LOC130957148 [Arachis stenosperma]|uniref:uncharacterized protein LOC130957148 n=1 Tax=Arachis stenosperma TaxID=217475 RepID=UPI0025AC4087|nr:uncharacterized protein LOC130957148 [Arachis stenosperma]
MPNACGPPPSGPTLTKHDNDRMPFQNLENQRRRPFFPLLLEIVISDNRTKFSNKCFKEFLKGLDISQKFNSVEHPQTNGQVEVANKVILKRLKKRLDEAKGPWSDEVDSVLCSYRMSPQSSVGVTHFKLTYGLEAITLVEIGEPIPQRIVGGHDETPERDL